MTLPAPTAPARAEAGRPKPAPAQATFADLGVPSTLVSQLSAQGITTPFPIQLATLADTLAGRDVLGRGRTGSGKTLAFALPLVARLTATAATNRRQPRRPRGLVLAPTRELATQIAATVQPLAQAAGLRVTTVFGGVSQGRQTSALSAGVDILIACPGRLEDLIGQGFCRLDAVEITILDEADHMADLGFLPAVRRLLDATPRGGQRMLFSATLDNAIDVLVRRYLNNPLTHSVDSAASPVAAMTHHVLAVAGPDDKSAVVRELASGQGRSLLFTRTKHGAKKLARQLTAAGIPAVDLHGNLSQPARERNLAAFSAGDVRVLVATDIAARGIHVDEIELVVHVDPPTEHKAYLHRSGRTARAGAGGDVVTVMLPGERSDVRSLARLAGISPVEQKVAPASPYTASLVGAVAPFVTPAPVAATVPTQWRPSIRTGSSDARKARPGAVAPAARKRGDGSPRTPRAAGSDASGRSAGPARTSAVEMSRAGGSRRGRR
jgi:superfamily II DNA/RNA helicase